MTFLARAVTVLAGLLAVSIAAFALAPRGHDAAGGPATPPGHKLVPVLAEEFDKPVLDPKLWGHIYADPGSADRSVAKRTLPGNAERQVYFDKDYLGLGLDPFRLHDGMVTITAASLDSSRRAAVMRELAGLPGQQENPALRNLAYKSGLLTTRGLFAQQHGYFEVRMRFTGGRGVWPAFWLLREDSRWPPEIDIVEALGHDPHTIYASVHSNFAPKHTTRRIAMAGDPAEFHRYGALWLPDRIEFYLDGRLSETIPATPDMDRPMYLLLNLAIGGNWPGDPDASTPFPARMDIDWVRVWRLEQP
jgi:beta-glucanase (GH16 family)